MWHTVADLFGRYMGTGLIMIWYLISLAYLWVNEKRPHIRTLFLYLPVTLLLLFFNPLFARLVNYATGDEIYWRILWLLPVTLVIAYTCVCVYGRLAAAKGRLSADLFALCMAGALAASGSYIYDSVSFSKAENIYHMPDNVVQICDAIQVPGREVMAVFPLEMVAYVRQYSPLICMPYGREIMMRSWSLYHPLYVEMEQKVIDMERLVPLAREFLCHYIIFRPDQEMKGEPEDYGWTCFAEIDGYRVYRDPEIELAIPQL